MKKIILAIAFVCTAAMSQAAQIKWQATAAKVYDGQNLYLLTSIAATYDSLAKFEETAVGIGQVAKSGPTAYKVAASLVDNGAITKTSNFYLAAIDGNTIHYLDVTSSFQTMVFAPPDSAPGTATAAFADVATSATTATIGGGPGPEPTPEPTSAMLLLLGMAGLALRRRHA